MKIEKVKNFNQYALAVIAILFSILLFILVAMALSEFIDDIKRSFRPQQQAATIIADKNAKENLKENKRTHLVHFREFDLIDTTRQIYAIPVSQTVLKEHEAIDETSFFGRSDKSSAYRYRKYNYRSSNSNMIIFNATNNHKHKLFDKRISINSAFYEKINGEAAMLLSTIESDTDKDGILDEGDLRTLYLYITKDKSLHSIRAENTTFLNFHILPNRNELVVRLGLDRNNNGKYEWDEPAVFYHYSITEQKLKPLLDTEILQQLQAILDGK